MTEFRRDAAGRVRRRRSRAAALLLAATLAAGAAACRSNDDVQVRLETRTPTYAGAARVEVRAQVTGPQRGLRYRWVSVLGEADPQESAEPMTLFRFADGTNRDRVSVEVWRDSQRVARSEVDVSVDARLVRLMAEQNHSVQLEITTIPPYDLAGGPDTRADIAGKVIGDFPRDYRILVYARADAWYIQPMPSTAHPIAADRTWSTWTHTGASYAALLVSPGASAPPRLDVLPQVGGDVLARTIVEGVRR